jgi:catalase
MWRSLAATAALTVTLTLPALVVAQEAPATQKSLPEQLVDAFNGVFGVHPGMRANHPKGVVLEGTFTPAASAASVSKAAHLQKKKTPVPVTVRFSAGSGQPNVPDTSQMPRGMAVKFSLPDGSKTDLVVLSFNGFPVATAEEFKDFLLAVGASGPDCSKTHSYRDVSGRPSGCQTFRGEPEATTGELRHAALFRDQLLQVHERERRRHIRSLPTPTRGR